MSIKAMLTPGIDVKLRIPYHTTPTTRLEHVTLEALRGAGIPSSHLPRLDGATLGRKPTLESSLRLSLRAESCLLDDEDDDQFDPSRPYRQSWRPPPPPLQ